MIIKDGSLRLFRLFGINVYAHWTWVLLIIVEKDWREARGAPLLEHLAEYLCLFAIVLLHEFGHALACKSVGGKADEIVLWLIGGKARVEPPPRPAPFLWSIAAGPLVNVILVPLSIGAVLAARYARLPPGPVEEFIRNMAYINLGLLIFNILPIYPLDGGQMLRCLLWFFLGRGTSLAIAAVIGIAGSLLLGLWALSLGSIWLGVVVAFMGLNSFNAVKLGWKLRELEKAPRHHDARCPECLQSPPAGNFWTCPCGTAFDTFDSRASCPNCARAFERTSCPWCGKPSPVDRWFSSGGFPVTPIPPSAAQPVAAGEPPVL